MAAPKTEEHKQKIRDAVRASWTPERKEELRQQRIGEANPMFGKSHTEAHKKRMKKRFSGEANPFYGKKHTDEMLRRLSEVKKGRAPRLRVYGITDEQYAAKLADGYWWCSQCKDFLKVDLFPPRKGRYRPNICRPCVHKRQLKDDYGVTREWYHAKIEEQGGGCALCGIASSGTRRLSVDHCHVSGKIRGVLCLKCNSAIERIEAHDGWLGRAQAYLDRYK